MAQEVATEIVVMNNRTGYKITYKAQEGKFLQAQNQGDKTITITASPDGRLVAMLTEHSVVTIKYSKFEDN